MIIAWFRLLDRLPVEEGGQSGKRLGVVVDRRPMYCWEAANSFEICSLRAAAKLCSAMAAAYKSRGSWSFAPPETGFGRHRLERARRQTRFGAGGVVAGWRDVVRGVGMEDRGEVLDVAPPGQLPLAAPVRPDPVLVAVVVGGEELVEGSSGTA